LYKTTGYSLRKDDKGKSKLERLIKDSDLPDNKAKALELFYDQTRDIFWGPAYRPTKARTSVNFYMIIGTVTSSFLASVGGLFAGTLMAAAVYYSTSDNNLADFMPLAGLVSGYLVENIKRPIAASRFHEKMQRLEIFDQHLHDYNSLYFHTIRCLEEIDRRNDNSR